MIDRYKLRKNHKFISSAGFIHQICEPLRYFNIHLFTYLKKFNDGSQINLSTNPKWIFDYYRLGLFKTSRYESGPQESGISLWPVQSTLPVFTHGQQEFDSIYGFTLCQKQEDGCEFYFFSLAAKQYKMLDVCLNNLDLMEQFIFYFKDKASSLLKECNDHRIVIPSSANSHSMLSDTDAVYSSDYLREKFSKAINGNALKRWLKNYDPLTKRENECLNLLMDFQTIPELANQLNLSKRTVETHLDRIKAKLHCDSKQELLIKLAHFSNMNK